MSHIHKTRALLSFAAALAVTALAIWLPLSVAQAGHGDVSLTDSNFEIDIDANLTVEHAAPSIDWGSVNEVRKADQPSGQNDNSFGNGTKEDTEVPVVVDGSIPPNKSDLLTFGVYEEEGAGGAGFMHLFWTRVQEPTGTTNMDFEFNQSNVVSANGVTPVRTAGDLLIVYELSKGGSVPELYLFTWLDGSEGIACEASNTFPCWGDRTDLDAAGGAAGSINSSPIAAADSDGLGDLSERTFGEASIDLDFIFDPEKCTSFGSAYLKSRSSDSFTAAMKDFIAPTPVNISNCGQVIVRKQTDPAGDPGPFDFETTVVTDPVNGAPFSLGDDGVHVISDVLAGTGYTVSETALPTGWDLIDVDCSASSDPGLITDITGNTVTFDMGVGETVDCTFTNQARGTIIVEKQTIPDGDPASFTFTGDAAGSISDGGTITVADLPPGTYSSTETVPVGWDLTDITCDDGNSSGDTGTATATFNLEPGETVTCTFTNTKRGSITVVKVTDPAGDPQTFTFSGDVGGILGDGGSASVEVVPGSYSSTETVPAGWDLTDISCDDGDSSGDIGTATASFNVSPGEDVTCTFTNTKRGTIILQKVTNPAGGAGPFGFSGDITGGIAGGGEIVVGDLVPGTYTTTENDPTAAGYRLDSIECDDGNSSGDVPSRTATYNLEPGETVTCVFTNSTGAIQINKTAKNFSAGGVAPLAGVTFDVSLDGEIVATVVTDAAGVACVDGLVPGFEYEVTETVPDGYALSAGTDNPQSVVVSAGATCGSGTPDEVDFSNDPLSEITISFESLAGPGVTVVTTITCTGPSADGSELGPLGDGESVTLTDLLEGEYHCVIYIDP